MAALPHPPASSVEDYLRTDYEFRTEYIEGELIQNPMGSWLHNLMKKLIARKIDAHESSHAISYYTEQSIRVSSERYRVPDIVIMRASHKRESIFTEAPLCTIEIVSPGEAFSDLQGKVLDHRAMGVPLAIIVDPQLRSLFVVGENNALKQVRPPLNVDIPTPKGPLTIPFDELFANLD